MKIPSRDIISPKQNDKSQAINKLEVERTNYIITSIQVAREKLPGGTLFWYIIYLTPTFGKTSSAPAKLSSVTVIFFLIFIFSISLKRGVWMYKLVNLIDTCRVKWKEHWGRDNGTARRKPYFRSYSLCSAPYCHLVAVWT